MESIYVLSTIFDSEGYAYAIMLLDRRMAMYMN